MTKPESADKKLERAKISPEDIKRYMGEIDTVLKMKANLAIAGYEDEPGTRKPWSVEDISGFCDSIIRFSEQKVRLYERAGMTEEAAAAAEKVEAVNMVMAELEGQSEVPPDFLQKFKDVVASCLEEEEETQ